MRIALNGSATILYAFVCLCVCVCPHSVQLPPDYHEVLRLTVSSP